MSGQMHDDFWTEVAAELRRTRKLQPLGRDEIGAELQSTGANELTEERISKILAFATSKDSVPAGAAGDDGGDLSVARFLQELSSSGLISTDEIRTVVEEQGEEPPRTSRDYALEFARRNLLRADDGRLDEWALVGDYLLLDTIGVGGMGDVFRALHLRMNRIVALKVVASRASRLRDNLRRFDSEIKALAQLNHPNILTAYDAGESGGVPYLVMEYVDGPDLARLVYRVGPLTPPLALSYVLQAARGLAYAHSKGVIHRDVKPSNMLVDHDGVVKISDLGLAKFAQRSDGKDGDLDATAPGTAVGTYAYMSPEQASGSDAVDARSDIYGLGCTMFFLLLGRPPAEGSTIEAKLMWHREGAIPSLRTHLPQLPERLDALLQRMLAKSPADRPASMAEAIEELEACQALLGGPSAAGTNRAADTTRVLGDRTPDAARRPAVTRAPEAANKPLLEVAARPRPTRLRWLMRVALLALLPIGLAAALAIGLSPDAPAPEFTNSIGMHLTYVPAGEFLMGAPVTEQGSLDKERPQHRVELTRPFYMGTYEVSVRQYYSVMDPERRIAGRHTRDDQPAAVDPGELPVVDVTWEEAVEFCRRLSSLAAEHQQGRTYRLPTEAEWEYCCRADTVTPYSTGDDITFEQANFGAEWRPPNTRFPGAPRLLEIGSFAPNPFGLHDMHGNALEWCLDRYGEYHRDAVKDPRGTKIGDQRVVRGGATTYKKTECRSAYRRYKHPHETNQFTGFRVVCIVKTE